MSKYYYHGCSIDEMMEIMKCQTIKTQRDLGYEEGIGFNGLDYISVCSKLPDIEYKKEHIDDAYNRYIKNSFCFIISDEVNAIKTKYLDWKTMNLAYNDIANYINTHSGYSYSDIIDEYQIKGSISFDYIIGIGVPFNHLDKLEHSNNKDICYDYKIFKQIIEMAKLFSFDIIDTSKDHFLENYENEKAKKSYVLTKI